MGEIVGNITGFGEIAGHLSVGGSVSGTVHGSGEIVGGFPDGDEIKAHLSGGNSIRGTVSISSVPPYVGEYEATPSWDEQVFATRGYRMTDDFTVNEIVKQEVSNAAGGLTLSI